jgi:uncharacterized membrane protein
MVHTGEAGMNDAGLTAPILSLSLALDAAWPRWAIAMACGVVILLAWWNYRCSGQNRRGAKILAILRGSAALLLLLVLAQPSLILSREIRPKPLLTLAIDTSASMARSDAAPVSPAGPDRLKEGPASRPAATRQAGPDTKPSGLTRLGAIVDALADGQGRLLRQLSQRYQVQLVAVSDRVVSRHNLDRPEGVRQALDWLKGLKADGVRTDLSGAAREILATCELDRTWAGFVLLSDGRRTAGAPLASLAESLHGVDCPAIAVPVGSDRSLPTLRLSDVQVAPRAFVGEPVAVRGWVEGSGLRSAVVARLSLVEASSGHLICERNVPLDPAASSGPSRPFALTYKPEAPGAAHLLLKIDSPQVQADPRSSSASLQVEAVDAKIRVLYVEREPRFEYRYLKNLLIREPTVISSILLLAADAEFPQEGSEPINRFPSSLQELDRYDVVLLGDLDPKGGWIDAAGLLALAGWVEQKGGGLGWMPGPRAGVQAWRDTPLSRVLPVRSGEEPGAASSGEPYRLVLTPEGMESPIFFLDGLAEPVEQGVASLPEWYWLAGSVRPSPAARVLAVHPCLRTAEGPVPLVATGHYGAGRTFYCGSDETWRWRRGNDIEHWRAFWLQAVRWLAGPRKLGAYRKMVLEASPSKIQAGRPVHLDFRVNDEVLAADLSERLPVTLHQAGGPSLSLWLQKTAGLATYSASFVPDMAGDYTAEVRLSAATQPVTATVSVQLPQAETADSPADVAALRQWIDAVRQVGGQGYLLAPDGLEELNRLPLPAARPHRRTLDVRLWDNSLALLLVAGLFLAEWGWRRARGMA